MPTIPQTKPFHYVLDYLRFILAATWHQTWLCVLILFNYLNLELLHLNPAAMKGNIVKSLLKTLINFAFFFFFFLEEI